MRIRVLIALLLVFLGGSLGAADSDPFEAFVTEYKALEVPEFQMSYIANFHDIPGTGSLEAQLEFFRRQQAALRRMDRAALSPEMRYRLDCLLYEIDFNLERLRLETRFLNGKLPDTAGTRVMVDPIANRYEVTRLPTGGLYRLPDGPEWYRLYLRRWASCDVTPEELLQLGQTETARVKGEIRAIQRQLGYGGRDQEFYRHLNDASFWTSDGEELEDQLTEMRENVRSRLSRDFETVDFPAVKIEPAPHANKDMPPGYYDRGVFYYNFFNHRFPSRSKEWLFLHEADPGHHYQSVVAETSLAWPFWYPGFSEGWGAYAEDLGKDLGCYEDPYQYLGKWEWDLVRSARLIVDVHIHYHGWTRDQALEWWRENVPNQEALAKREVDRIIRWPAQIVSYKVGEHEILDLRAKAERRLGPRFDPRRFHTTVLERGSIPLPVLERVVEDELSGRP